jgi:hypothetical protein
MNCASKLRFDGTETLGKRREKNPFPFHAQKQRHRSNACEIDSKKS